MGKFLVGLVVGLVVGIMVMTANPDLPQELRVNLAHLTALVMRNAEDTAEELGDAAENLADEAGEAADATPSVTAPVTPAEKQEAESP